MIFTMPEQINMFIFSILSGVIIGIFFDLYRTIRGFERVNSIIMTIEDILFWILMGIIIFIFMLYTSYAYMSFNIFAYMVLGFAVYNLLFSKKIMKGLISVFMSLGKFNRIIFYRLIYPFKLFYHKFFVKK